MPLAQKIIPDWLFVSDPSGQVRPQASARLQRGSAPQVIQTPTVAEDASIPIVYGGPERIAGMPYTICLASNGLDLLMSFIVCEGEVERVANIEVNNGALPAGVTFSAYAGTQVQGVDPDLALAIPGFDEAMLGTCYLVGRFKPGSVNGVPSVTAEVYGRKIVDRARKGVTLLAPATNYITLALSAGNRINGATALDISYVGALTSWGVSAVAQVLVSKWSAAAPVASFQFNAAGLLRIYLSSDGATLNIFLDCPVLIVPLAAGQFGGVRVVVNLASGGNRTAQFYYSTDGIAWQALGALVTQAGAAAVVDAGALPWQVAGLGAGAGAFNAIGTSYAASVKIAGVERVRFNPEDAPDGAVTWLAPTGEAWTITGGPTVQTRAAFASTNPAVILDDFMRTFGRRAVNAASVKIARDYCDTLMSDGTKRATLTITLAEARDANEWIEVLRGYIPAWVVFKDSEWHIIPDAPSAPALAYDADTDNRTDGDEPMALVKRGVREVPNVIEVGYTDTSVKPWTEKKASAAVPGIGTGQRRKAALAMPGIRSYSQAYRFAVERLNHFTLEAIEGQVAVMDDGVKLLPGDIVTITDSAHGWAAKPVRLLRVEERDNGRWSLRFREYNAGAYSTDAPAAPALPSSGTLPNPINVSAITGLAAAEVLRFEKNLDTSDGLARGLIWQSRIEASWAASPDSFLDYYEIALAGATLTQPAVTTSKLPQFSSATLIQGTSYQVQVRVVNTLGFVGPWASVIVVVNGKTAPPSDVTVVDFAAEIGGEAILRWRAVPDVDVVRYEWRALATSAVTAPWDTMTLLDRPDTTYTRIRGLSPGATLFAVKAIDSVGRYSVNPFYVPLIITSDSASFLQSFDFVPASGSLGYLTTSNVPLFESVVRPLPRWITKGETVWDAALPNPVASLATPVVSAFGRVAAWNLVTGVWDFGIALEAVVKLNLTWFRSLKGTVRLYLNWSTDGVTFGDYSKVWIFTPGAVSPGLVQASVAARFLRIEVYPDANDGSMILEGPINAQVSSSTRKESGNATSSASTFTRINLAQKYTKAVSITITAQGSTFGSPSYNNVIVGLSTTPNSFDVYMFNAAGAQIAVPFSWKFEGV